MRVVRSMFGVVAATVLVGVLATPAQAQQTRAEGSVLVFSNELTASTRFADPAGCTRLPVDAHLLTNLTDADIRVFGDPFCRTASLVVAPGTGAHIQTPMSSFSA